MKRFAQEYVIREEDAENIVQDVFLELWNHREFLADHTNIFSFLFTIVRNRSIDFLRHNIVRQKTADKLQSQFQRTLQLKLNSLEVLDTEVFQNEEIESIVQKAIESLPERCRQIFVMNKFEGKKQKQIAKELNISINTVESQMVIAHKKLRKELKEYIPLLIFVFI